MAIRLETSQRTGIENHQDAELSAILVDWAKRLRQQYPNARPRTSPSAQYNCHGLTFAARRTWVYKSISIATILDDDQYEEVSWSEVLPGDIVIYYSEEGDPNHSGVVVEAGGTLVAPIICSKWAHAGEFVHGLRDCPNMYGPNTEFFRCVR